VAPSHRRLPSTLVAACLALCLVTTVSLSPAGTGGFGVPPVRADDLLPGTPRPPAPVRPVIPPLPSHCRSGPSALERANLALAGRYALGNHPVVTLGLDPAWTEDPLGDWNWQFMFHSLPTVAHLLEALALTGDQAYRARASALLQDWIADNPRHGAASTWAWNDHATALRAVVLTCAVPYFRGAEWLTDALRVHGATLADPAFYVDHGNHALNQSIGLLEVAHVLGRGDWQRLAAARIGALLLESVDAQGVTNEHATGYQVYNRSRYLVARARMQAMGMPIPAAFSRISLMPNFIAHSSLPDGTLEHLGDTDTMLTPKLPGTWSEFVATKGASGPKPSTTLAVYRAGFLFCRSGWGERRPWADEVFYSLRWGPAPYIHGHADGTGITLYGYGSRLLLDPGKYSYNADAYRSYFKGRSAHNVVTVDGQVWNPKAATTLLGHSSSPTMVHALTSTEGYAGVAQQRAVTFSRGLNYLLVDDRLTASSPRTFRQLWHLSATANPLLSTNRFATRNSRGNLLVRQLVGAASQRVVKGLTTPIQGWISYRHGHRVAAPVVEVVKTGATVRYLTLVVPAAGAPSASVSKLTLTTTGYSLVVTIGTRSERVTVDGTAATITPI
jgi:hypothetical protein